MITAMIKSPDSNSDDSDDFDTLSTSQSKSNIVPSSKHSKVYNYKPTICGLYPPF